MRNIACKVILFIFNCVFYINFYQKLYDTCIVHATFRNQDVKSSFQNLFNAPCNSYFLLKAYH